LLFEYARIRTHHTDGHENFLARQTQYAITQLSGEFMSNPNNSSIPGMGAMSDTIDFMKNLWGGMSVPGLSGMKIPGMVMPTLSVEEINKQIKDLKSVESWLTMNLSMLRGTIQALEVQSATITTIQTMSASLAEAMKPAAKPDAPAKTEKPGKPAFESPFAASPEKAPAADASADNTSGAAASAGDSAPLIPPMANPAAWWNVLQDQFKQAVDTAAAMTPDMPAKAETKTSSDDKPASPSGKPAAAKAPKSATAKAAGKAPAKSKKE
jgi:hypothetical protein